MSSANPSAASNASVGIAITTNPTNSAKRLKILGESGVEEDCVPLDQEEALTLETLDGLIQMYESNDKACLIARVKTRDTENVRSFHYDYYCAHQLNKVIFRKGPSELISRYHPVQPIMAKNPLSNQDIVGEVSYYKIVPLDRNAKKQSFEMASPILAPSPVPTRLINDDTASLRSRDMSPRMGPATLQTDVLTETLQRIVQTREESSPSLGRLQRKASKDSSLTFLPLPNAIDEVISRRTSRQDQCGMSESTRVAQFIGTDYNYLHSSALRMEFSVNSLNDDNELLIQSVQIGSSINPFAGLYENEILSFITRLRSANLQPQAGVLYFIAYSQARLSGMILTLYLLVCLFVSILGLRSMLTNPGESGWSIWVCVLIPFLSFLNDRMTQSMFQRPESGFIVFAKMMSWCIYIFLPVSFFKKEDSDYHYVRTSMDIIFPWIFLAYSFFYVYLAKKGRIVV
eukprot:TRINITY_DN9675_c0_g1_i1.p1 TRINITY_DN9675_c0_g1~~TRINITY_DN9675_c0_g1_i1.p1  ORF type:complete len:459 (+),score=87.42 TRINITY_DN9675_c0_g1_i1:68-1444(+)